MATPTAKMNYDPISLLSAHFLLPDLSQPDQIDVQEVVDYCEARFCFVLQAMLDAIEEDQMRLSGFLFRELVF